MVIQLLSILSLLWRRCHPDSAHFMPTQKIYLQKCKQRPPSFSKMHPTIFRQLHGFGKLAFSRPSREKQIHCGPTKDAYRRVNAWNNSGVG
jgi:hypothetical protein